MSPILVPLQPITIAVDAMGGDFAPSEVVRGAVEFVRRHPDDPSAVLLVGDENAVRAELAKAGGDEFPGRLAIHPTDQIIGMDEHPMEAFRAKPNASLVVCNALVKDGTAQAAFSAGNTGAMLVSAMQILERIEGVKRPAIAAMFPTETGGRAVVVDAGANVDCRPSHLLHFALLGSIYAERVLGVESPRIGLLANGEEDSKGNDLTREAFNLLQAARPRLNFIGNVEGNHVFEGRVDVVVCDGFIGNVLLKGAEGIVRLVLSLLSAEAQNAPSGDVQNALLASLLRMRKRVDYSEFGGAPLLGVNGVTFIAHGRSDWKAIASGIELAASAARSGYVEAIRDALKPQNAKEATA